MLMDVPHLPLCRYHPGATPETTYPQHTMIFAYFRERKDLNGNVSTHFRLSEDYTSVMELYAKPRNVYGAWYMDHPESYVAA